MPESDNNINTLIANPSVKLAPNDKGRGIEVSDFGNFCEGDKDPSLNKTIKTLVYGSKDLIVYLDDQDEIQWSTASSCSLDANTSKTISTIIELEVLCKEPLTQEEKQSFKVLLAQSLADSLIGQHDAAQEVLLKARAYLQEKATENYRICYVIGAVFMTLLSMSIALLLWVNKDWVLSYKINIDIVLGMLFGSLGALLSIFTRLQNIEMSTTGSRKYTYISEGVARVIVGEIGALLTALAIKSNVVVGLVNSFSNPLAGLLAFCIVAAFSERFVPSLIKKFEGSLPESETESKSATEPKPKTSTKPTNNAPNPTDNALQPTNNSSATTPKK
ncbi:MAG: hypothetical protein WAQ98_07560 [Blastocatellia bacterium]